MIYTLIFHTLHWPKCWSYAHFRCYVTRRGTNNSENMILPKTFDSPLKNTDVWCVTFYTMYWFRKKSLKAYSLLVNWGYMLPIVMVLKTQFSFSMRRVIYKSTQQSPNMNPQKHKAWVIKLLTLINSKQRCNIIIQENLAESE